MSFAARLPAALSRLAPGSAARYNMRMKRTNLVLDEKLLEEAVRLAGTRTYSQAVNEALADYIRRIKARKILQLAGSGVREGDLPSMRRDRRRRSKREVMTDDAR